MKKLNCDDISVLRSMHFKVRTSKNYIYVYRIGVAEERSSNPKQGYSLNIL